jgi:hypothetical protein
MKYPAELLGAVCGHPVHFAAVSHEVHPPDTLITHNLRRGLEQRMPERGRNSQVFTKLRVLTNLPI